MGRAACEHAAYGLADAPTPDLAFESFLARTLYGHNRPTNGGAAMAKGGRWMALSTRSHMCVAFHTA